MKFIPILTTFFAIYTLFGFGLAWYFRRNDIVDMMWGPGIAAFAWIAYLNVGTGIAWIIPVIISIWALRLSIHIGMRASEKEDSRYAAWRQEWMKKGERYFYIRSFFQVFVLQGILMSVVALPAILAAYFGWGDRITWWQIIGILVWIEGFAIESIADWQLVDFIKRRHAGLEKETFMKRGIWAWSRHPNYFGEVEQWWGIFLIALTPNAPWTWLGIISPLVITFLILKVSGIPLLEASFDDNPEYQEYKKNVNAFVPWPRKKKAQKAMINTTDQEAKNLGETDTPLSGEEMVK
jgi:steroid 5-alpha reductase family enzyme